MFNSVSIKPINNNQQNYGFGVSNFYSENPYGNFWDFNNSYSYIQQYLFYQSLLNEILYNTNIYNGWDNIPLFDSSNYNFDTNYDFGFKFNNDYTYTEAKTDKNYAINKSLIEVGYDYIKGKKLAKIAKRNATGFRGQCATEAKNSIQQANLGKYEKGHAYMCKYILDKNPNFKRVDISLQDLKHTSGIVLVYDRGVSGYSKEYGHIEITGGDGCAYSDGVTGNIRPGYIAYAPV